MKAPDGSAGQRFIEIGGETVIQTEIQPGLWTFPAKLDLTELRSLGIEPSLLSGARQVMVKMVDGDTEWVTRLTMLVRPELSGEKKFTSLTTLQGFHRRIR